MKNINLLGVSGSLRANSSNTYVLQAAKVLTPEKVSIQLYFELDRLPHFNPDLDREPFPSAIISLRQQIKDADGIIISSPEYAHGVPGSLKNALDWLVSSVEFPHKPVLLINTNPRATIALASLQEILLTMSARIIPDHNLTLAIAGRGLDTQGIIDDSELSTSLQQAIATFIRAIKSQ